MRNQLDKFSELSFFEKVILIFSAGFIYLAIFKGTEITLFWIPRSWGGYDEDGDFVSLITNLASYFSFVVGTTFISSLIEGSKSHFDVLRQKKRIDYLEVKAFELERIAKSLRDGVDLNFLKDDFERKIRSEINGQTETYVSGIPRKIDLNLYKELLIMLQVNTKFDN